MADEIIEKTNKIVEAIFSQAHEMRLENIALRMLLRRQGLSDATIQRRVNAYRKLRKDEDSALLRYQQLLAEMLERLPVIDLEATIAKMQPKGPVH